MAPEIVRAKIVLLQQVLGDLKPHVNASREEQESAHYEIERQVQLSVELCLGIGRRMLSLASSPIPDSGAGVFQALLAQKTISPELAQTLSKSVGLRNLIVHEYGEIDYDRFFEGLPGGFAAFVEFAEVAAQSYP